MTLIIICKHYKYIFRKSISNIKELEQLCHEKAKDSTADQGIHEVDLVLTWKSVKQQKQLNP